MPIEVQHVDLTFRIRVLLISIALLLLLTPLFLIQPINELFMNWASIPILNWLRLIAAIILTSFVLGFLTLKLIIRNDKVSTLSTIALSYILSMFITPLLYFIATISSHEHFFGLVVGYTLTSSILLLLKRNKQRKQLVIAENKPRSIFSIRIHIPRVRASSLILVFSFMLWLLGFLAIQITSQLSGSFFISGVNPNHFNWSVAFMKDFPWWVVYPWWFHAYVASLFTSSGFPLTNAFVTLSIFSSVTVVFIYLFGNAFLKNKNIAALATIFASFQGFGWIYFVLSRINSPAENLFQSLWDVSSKSRDIIWGTVLLPSTFSPIFFVGIPAFLALLFVMYSDEFSTSSKYILVALITALLYLSHGGYDLLLFTAIFALFCIFDRRIRNIGFPLAVLLGLSFVALIDVVSPYYVYITSITTNSLLFWGGLFWTLNPLYMSSVIIPVITCLIIRIFNKRNLNLHPSSIWKFFAGKTLKLSLLAIVYLYIIFWLTWISAPSTFDESNLYIYSYPVRLGVNMVLPILAFYFLSKEKNQELKDKLSLILAFSAVLILIVPFFRLVGQFGLNLPFFTIVNENRLSTYLVIFISLVNSYVVIRSLQKSRLRSAYRKISDSAKPLFLLFLILMLGLTSTIFSFYGLSVLGLYSPVKASNEELEALNYLRVNGESDKTILTVSADSRNKIATFTGFVNPMLYAHSGLGDWYHLLSTPSPEIAFYLLNEYRVKYIYLPLNDLTLLRNQFNNGFLAKLVGSLPVFFRNDYVTILEIPKVSYPISKSPFNVIAPLETMPNIVNLYASLKNSETLQFHSCDTLDFVGTTRAQVVIDTDDKREGNSSIKATVTDPTNAAIVYFLAASMPEKYRNVTTVETLFLWVKSSAGNITVEVGITTWRKGQSYWRFAYRTANEWQGIVVPLKKPDGVYLSPADYSNVSLIEIKAMPPLIKNMTFSIDDLFFSSYSPDPDIASYESLLLLSSFSRWNYSTRFVADPFASGTQVMAIPFDPLNDTYGYLDYVQSGGKLVIFNTLGPGFFSKVLSLAESTNSSYVDTILTSESTFNLHSLEVPRTLTLDGNTSVLAFFAANNSVKMPFVFFKPYGKGSIYYVEAQFLPSIMTNGTPQMLDNMIEVGNALHDSIHEITISADKGVDSVYDYGKKGLSWWSHTTNDVTVSGLINIESDGLVFPSNLTSLEVIQFSNDTGEFYLSNSSVLSLKVIGSYEVKLSALRVQVEESELAPYLSINVQGPSNITLLPQDRGEIHMVIQKNGLREQIIARKLLLDSTLVGNIILKSPLISFEGAMLLNDTWIWPGNTIMVLNELLTLQGKGAIRFILAGQNFTYLSVQDFEGNAVVLKGEAPSTSISETAYLWEAIGSNLGLLVSTVFIVIFILILLNFRIIPRRRANSNYPKGKHIPVTTCSLR